ncbi:hypothetical protein [Flavobacterium algicola]|uniref:hypothetical protein n=1 Tax=Flavobacterium algicola TaxID=556529 RepID=UPI001EFC8BAF|nr:hypothetical protein [Flavobacterium algicola]MCG9792436.1 hypothetical protein [Flavobacterium algicola]
MQKQYFFFLLLFIISKTVSSQNNTTLIKIQDKEVYLTTTIGRTITGTYLFDGISEPIVQLNSNGTGVYQLTDLSQNTIKWGIESNEKGYPAFTKGFDSAKYTLWYKKDNDTEENWTSVQLSIHFNKKKIFIAGERSKDYVDEI